MSAQKQSGKICFVLITSNFMCRWFRNMLKSLCRKNKKNERYIFVKSRPFSRL